MNGTKRLVKKFKTSINADMVLIIRIHGVKSFFNCHYHVCL
ncbi:hypothetical protein S1OALGB6SA_181 [Olavius algarvensis spirochete endosymbiont]|nr:hypothetical protein S1OALGB6SA_181 [Olavius algarvensis spirochete endosymbiont]